MMKENSMMPGQREPQRKISPFGRNDLGQTNNRERGQSLVEAALFFSVLVLILMGLVDLGRAYFYFLALQNAAEEGASYGAVHPGWNTPADEPDPNNVVYRAQHESENDFIDWDETVVTVDAPDLTAGNVFTVTMEYEYDLITPVIRNLVGGGSMTLKATVKQVFLSELPPES